MFQSFVKVKFFKISSVACTAQNTAVLFEINDRLADLAYRQSMAVTDPLRSRGL